MEHQCAQLDAFARERVGRRRRVGERGVRMKRAEMSVRVSAIFSKSASSGRICGTVDSPDGEH